VLRAPSQQHQPPQTLKLHEEPDAVDVVAAAADVVTTLATSVVRNIFFSNNDKRTRRLAQIKQEMATVRIWSNFQGKKLCHVLIFITISFP